ncbi:hypothetical protein BDN70DRAFT_623925 [Pholiota conissans]|uniref:Uncharacterized protein n=1 Tax=Pholiota conissans TaxID=109636 RepID=A0A9P6CR80_9AGAR|nr:hypothetical protein BDN70DRAFT_623925 [Pholiota conissans]
MHKVEHGRRNPSRSGQSDSNPSSHCLSRTSSVSNVPCLTLSPLSAFSLVLCLCRYVSLDMSFLVLLSTALSISSIGILSRRRRCHLEFSLQYRLRMF